MVEADNTQVGAMLGGSFKCCMCDTKHQKLEGQLNVARCWEKLQERLFNYHCSWAGSPNIREGLSVDLRNRVTGLIDIVCPEEMNRMSSAFKYLLAAPTKDNAVEQFQELYMKKIEELKDEVRRQLICGEAKIKTQFQSQQQHGDGALRTKDMWLDPTWKDWDLILGDERMAHEAMGLAYQGIPLDVRAISQGYRGAVLYCVKRLNWTTAFNRYSSDRSPYWANVDRTDLTKVSGLRHADHLMDVLVTSKGTFRLTRQLDTVKEAERALRLTDAPVSAILPRNGKQPSEAAAEPGGVGYLGAAWLPPVKSDQSV